MKPKIPKTWKEYEEQVQKLEEEGMSTSDAQGVVDALLIENGYSPLTLKKAKELIPDGNAADQPDSDFDPKQLAMGVKVELEHTKNKALAKEIAKDHLAEIPDYYTKLIKMEREASHDFKSFDDPWKVMPEEDRREANRLFKAVMKAFPNSPKQKELSDKLQAILKKHGIGDKREASLEPEKINLKERWDNKEWNKLDGAPEEDVLTQPLRSRKDYGMEKNSYYRRNTYYKNDPFWMTTKYGGDCKKCGEHIKKNETIWYYPKDKTVYCSDCGKVAEKEFLSAVEDEEFYNRQYSSKLKKIADSLRKSGAYAQLGNHQDVKFLEEESKSKPEVEVALKLLVRMDKEIKDKDWQAIKEFRKDYLKQTGGGYFDTSIRDAIARIYTAIADKHGLRDEADEYWS